MNDYTHELGADTVIQNLDCYKIIMTPKPDAPVVWGKLIVYIEKVEINQLLIYYYDEDGYLVNTMTLSDIKNMDGRNIPTRMEMVPAEEPEDLRWRHGWLGRWAAHSTLASAACKPLPPQSTSFDLRLLDFVVCVWK